MENPLKRQLETVRRIIEKQAGGQPVSSIDRDIALEDLRHIYRWISDPAFTAHGASGDTSGTHGAAENPPSAKEWIYIDSALNREPDVTEADQRNTQKGSLGENPSEKPQTAPSQMAYGQPDVPGQVNEDVTQEPVTHPDNPRIACYMNFEDDIVYELKTSDIDTIVSELFEGDRLLFNEFMHQITRYGDLNEALIFIQENYDWPPDSPSLHLIVELLNQQLS